MGNHVRKKGRLHLFPSPISEETNDHFSRHLISNLFVMNYFITERARTARRWLSSLKFPRPIDGLHILEMDKNQPGIHTGQLIDWLHQGKDVALLSEAGTPCIADPGNLYVSACHNHGFEVHPYVGPNSIILALMVSGFNGQQFVFHGYLPIKEHQLKPKLISMEQAIQKNKQTQIFIETPYRNDRLLKMMCSILKPQTQLCIASSISSQEENIKTYPIKKWKILNHEIGKQNTVFLLG